MAVTVVPKGSGELAAVLKTIHKQFGEGVGGQGVKLKRIKRIPTGIFPLDLAMGGGFPQNRLCIVYGPEGSGKSNLALLACKHVQTHCSVCDKDTANCICEEGPTVLKAVYIDIENTFDSMWASQLGINTEEIVLLQPEYAEQAADIVEAVLHASDVGIVVLDSIAALTTTAMIDNSAEKAEMGGAALVTTKLVKKATMAMSSESKRDHHPLLLCINQTRTRLGVMYGDPECLHQDTLVNFVDGNSIPIRKVVEERIPGPVWAYDESSKRFVPAEIEEYFYNGKAVEGDFISILTEGVDTSNGVLGATVTKTHKFLTVSGWKLAGDLTVDDKLVTRYRSIITGTLREFLLGALCGDITCKRRETRRAHLRIQDTVNPDYAEWKASILGEHFQIRKNVTPKGREVWVTSDEFQIYEFGRPYEGCRSPQPLFENFSWLAFAIWIMDDGYYGRDRYTLSIGRFKKDQKMKEYISSELYNLGLDHSWNNKSVVFTKYASDKIVKMCGGYFPPCMHYKLPEYARTQGLTKVDSLGAEFLPTEISIKSIEPASHKKYRQPGLYDLSIKTHHNYSVGNLKNGFVVHNSQPGGKALQYASSMSVRIYGKEMFDKDISSVLPTFKETSVIIKKWKAPIVAKSSSYNLCVLPHNGKPVGWVDDFPTVKSYLESYGLFGKNDKNKFTCIGLGGEIEEYNTLTAIRAKYDAEPEFNAFLRKIIIDTELKTSGINEGGTA